MLHHATSVATKHFTFPLRKAVKVASRPLGGNLAGGSSCLQEYLKDTKDRNSEIPSSPRISTNN